ncbi:TetR/AcrR family transcriptional regulator [Dactylosporangium sp. CS-033363]|uniref:TetR/AcrR family transcriptional regulator n=1 Tax=Dactylosporangium sp. CS-033363 TaxID=3239935 RepID=UPI003D91F397
MPPPNDRRRAAIADAAIDLLVEAGVHGVTHRAVDARAALPAGTTSNYLRSREALLVAVTERVAELHQADMAAAVVSGGTAEALIAASLLLSATTHRRRYLAIFELHLESLRRPALADALGRLQSSMAAYTIAHHAEAGLNIPPGAVPALLTLYGGALYTLVTAPSGTVTPELTGELATAIVRGALG